MARHSSFSESGLLAKSRVVDTLAKFFGLKPKTSEECDGVVGVSKTRLSKTDDGLVPEEEDDDDVNAVVDERKHEAAIVIAASAVKHDCDELS